MTSALKKVFSSDSSSSNYTLPIVLSVVAHGLLVILVAWGWESASPPKQKVMPRYVEATLVTIKPTTKQKAAPKPKPKVVDVAAKRREQERQKAEADRKKRLAQEKAERERLRKLAEEKEKKRLEAEKKLKEEERLAEEKRRQEEQRREQERLKQQKLEQQQREAAFSDALAEEQALLSAQEDQVTAQGYVALMAQRIEQNWSRPPSARKGMKCELRIQLIPTGEVVNVTIIDSSGNAAFDRSAEMAVKKVGRFDELKDVPPDVFESYFREVTLIFNPQDLRL